MSTRTLRWLHRIGYTATLIVIAEIGTVAWFVGRGWMRSHAIAAAQREENRTHAGSLIVQHSGIVHDDAQRLLADLPPLNSLGREAVRFVAMPSFGRQWFAVALRADGKSTHGVLAIMRHRGTDDLGAATTQAFVMPAPAYKTLTAETYRLAAGWDGEDGFWTDGTPFGFELLHKSKVISGIGNPPAHYGKIALTVRNGLAPYVQAIAEVDSDWVSRQAFDKRDAH